MAAVTLIVVVGMAALAVDLGTLYVSKRRQQSATDLAAIAAVSDLARPRDAANATLARNGLSAASLSSLETGRYTPDAALAPAARFTPLPPGADAANAVRVVTSRTAPLFFGRAFAARAADGTSGMTITSRAVATQASVAAFALGSRLAALDGGLLNGLLGGLLGTNLSLTLLDYQALAGAKVDVVSFLRAAAARANLTAGTYDTLLDGRLRVGEVLGALGEASRPDAQFGPAAAAALSRIALAKAGSADTMALRGLVDLGPQDARTIGSATIGATISALDLLAASAQLANGTRQVQASVVTGLPGLAAATVSLVIGQRPAGTSFVAVGARGATVSTAQARLFLKVQILGTGPLPSLTLPILIDLARSTASLSAVQCEAGDGTRGGATLAVQPGLADAWIGAPSPSELTDLSTRPNPMPAVIAQVGGLASLTARARASLGNLTPTPVVFTTADVTQGVRKRVATTDYVAALLAGLNRDLSVQVAVPVVGVDLNGLAVGGIAAAAPALDQLVANVLASLGLAVGQAEVWVTGVRCLGGALVN